MDHFVRWQFSLQQKKKIKIKIPILAWMFICLSICRHGHDPRISKLKQWHTHALLILERTFFASNVWCVAVDAAAGSCCCCCFLSFGKWKLFRDCARVHRSVSVDAYHLAYEINIDIMTSETYAYRSLCTCFVKPTHVHKTLEVMRMMSTNGVGKRRGGMLLTIFCFASKFNDSNEIYVRMK